MPRAVHQEPLAARCQVMDADWFDIWLIAGMLVDEHGSRAIAVAKARAERALSEDDRSENAVWCAVGAAAETYLRDAKPADPVAGAHPLPARMIRSRR